MNLDLNVIALLLVIVGALNWGTVALFNLDLVKIVGNETIEKVIKIAVAGAAVLVLLPLLNDKIIFAQ